MSESFEKEFSALRELGPEAFVLRGSSIIVEIMPDEEIKTAGGLIMATSTDHIKGNSIEQHKLRVARVLMVGEGYYDEEKEGYEPLDVKVGAVVIVPPYSPEYISVFPGIQRPTGNKLAFVKFAQILALFPSQEAYELAKSKLN